MQLRVATCLNLPEPDPDAAPLARALAERGIDAELVAWDDPRADWDSPVPTIVRSTWSYSLARERFVAWAERVERAAPLFNSAPVIRANSHKRYLLELAARGVAIVPTQLLERGDTLDSIATLPERFVVKPAVGAGSLGARTFTRDELTAARAHVADWSARGDVLVQPYMASVDDYGERSLVWIDGELTHAIRKSPRFSGQDESVTGPWPITADERALADAALAPWRASILYARVDLVRDAFGAPRVMELELIEPSLFFAQHPPAARRYVDGLLRHI